VSFKTIYEDFLTSLVRLHTKPNIKITIEWNEIWCHQIMQLHHQDEMWCQSCVHITFFGITPHSKVHFWDNCYNDWRNTWARKRQKLEN